MSLARKLQALRREITEGFEGADSPSVSGAFGATGFSPLTETALSLLLLLRRQTGQVAGFERFRKTFLDLLNASDRAARIEGLLPDQPALVRERLLQQLNTLKHLPAAFSWKIYTAKEAAALPSALILQEIYLTLLKREIEPAALAAWSGLLEQGSSLQEVIQSIANSPEAAMVKSERHIVVLDDLPAETEDLILRLRHLQDVELQRLYDFARLLALLDPLEAEA